MSIRFTASIGFLTGVIFIVGFIVLFIFNPQTYEELNNLSLASYNIHGMHSRLWIATIYSITGLLNVVFSIGLFWNGFKKSASLVGNILLIACGIIWSSFGFFVYDPTTDMSIHMLLIRLIVFIIASLTGLLLLGVEYSRLAQNQFLKWFTLLSASLIALLSFLSNFIYNDETWIRTNLSLIVYFVWLSVFGFSVFRDRYQHSS